MIQCHINTSMLCHSQKDIHTRTVSSPHPIRYLTPDTNCRKTRVTSNWMFQRHISFRVEILDYKISHLPVGFQLHVDRHFIHDIFCFNIVNCCEENLSLPSWCCPKRQENTNRLNIVKCITKMRLMCSWSLRRILSIQKFGFQNTSGSNPNKRQLSCIPDRFFRGRLALLWPLFNLL